MGKKFEPHRHIEHKEKGERYEVKKIEPHRHIEHKEHKEKK